MKQTLHCPCVCRHGTSSQSFSMEKRSEKEKKMKNRSIASRIRMHFFISHMQGLMALALASSARFMQHTNITKTNEAKEKEKYQTIALASHYSITIHRASHSSQLTETAYARF